MTFKVELNKLLANNSLQYFSCTIKSHQYQYRELNSDVYYMPPLSGRKKHSGKHPPCLTRFFIDGLVAGSFFILLNSELLSHLFRKYQISFLISCDQIIPLIVVLIQSRLNAVYFFSFHQPT